MDLSVPSDQRAAPSGRIPLAVVVVDDRGLVSHWSTGARRLFGIPREEAVGRPAADLLPVGGVLDAQDLCPDEAGEPGPSGRDGLDGGLDDGTGPVLASHGAYPAAGRARINAPARDREPADVLWWAYPLVGPGPERLLVLAADAAPLQSGAETHAEYRRIAPGFALHTEFPGAAELAGRLPDILPNMGPQRGGRIAAQVLELGYPVLEISRHDRVPVTPDWGVPLRLDRPVPPPRAEAPADPRPGPDAAETDLECAAVRERLEFLNEVSGRIGSSLDLARTIREVTSAAVPRFCDFAGTHLRAQVPAGEGFPDGVPDVTTVWRRVWVEHDDEPGRWDDTVPVGETLRFPEQTPFFQCMVTGEPVLIERVTDELGERIARRFEKRDLRPLIRGRSFLAVPLKARDTVLGFMVLMRRPDRAPFNDMDRVTAAELAARAGLVLDNARMYTRQERVAEALQESMLPKVAPRLPGCELAARYLPGTRLGRVGGDWVDAVRLPGSRVALVVGDVMGHGLDSAAMMGQLRTAVQTMAGLDLPPGRLLRGLDDLAQRLGEQYLATCLYAVYDPVASRLEISNAGHIPPVLVRGADGRGELLTVPTGAPVGVGGVPFETATVPVEPGDRLVLCTDGLVEARGEDIGTRLAALCESAAHPAASPDEACDTIIRALGARGGGRDDVALLLATLHGIPPRDVVSSRLARDPREVSRARRLTRQTLADWGLQAASETAEVLVGELVTNAVRHAHTGAVGLRLVRADALLCEVSDDDQALPTLMSAGPQDEGGRGLRIVSRLARQWGVSRQGSGKSVWFEQALPGAGT